MKAKDNKSVSKIIQKKQSYREKNQISFTQSARRTQRFFLAYAYSAVSAGNQIDQLPIRSGN